MSLLSAAPKRAFYYGRVQSVRSLHKKRVFVADGPLLLADVAWQISPECLRFICRDSYLERQGHALKHAPSQGASAFACKPQQVMPQRELWHFLLTEGDSYAPPASALLKAQRQAGLQTLS